MQIKKNSNIDVRENVNKASAIITVEEKKTIAKENAGAIKEAISKYRKHTPSR